MPPARCSNCNRSANAVIGCQNPRCVNIVDIHPLYCPVESPSRCSGCGGLMNAIVGCQNPRCSILESVDDESRSFCSQFTDMGPSSFLQKIQPDLEHTATSQSKTSGSLESEILPLVEKCAPSSIGSNSEEKSLNQDLSLRAVAPREYRQAEVEGCDTQRDQQLETNAKEVSELEFHVNQTFCELLTMYNELDKKLSTIMVDQKQLTVETDKLKDEQAEFRRMENRLDENYADICAAEDKNAASMTELISQQTSLNQTFTDKLAALENLGVKMDECFSKVDRLSTTNTNVNCELLTMYNELNKKLSTIMVDQKQSTVETDKLKNEQIEFRRVEKRLDKNYADICAAKDKYVASMNKLISQQMSRNQTFTDKLAALENLEVKIDECFSKVDQLSTTNTNAIATLRSSVDEKYHKMNTPYNELKELLAQISLSHKELATENAKFVDEQMKIQRTRENTDRDITEQLGVLENRLTELDGFIVNKLDQQLAIDLSAAAEFHTFAYEKYHQLDTTCNSQQVLLTQISVDQKELAAQNTWLSKDQTELRQKLDRVVAEQMECTCSEMRMMLNRTAEDRKKLQAENARLVNNQAILERKLERVEDALVEQRTLIHLLVNSQEDSPIAIRIAALNALHREIDPEDIIDANETASEERRIMSMQRSSE